MSAELTLLESQLPLRIMGRSKRVLVSPGMDFYEWFGDDRAYDIATLDQISPRIVEIRLVDKGPREKGYLPFERQLLISKVNGKIIVTMSGYEFEGPVDVHAWKDLQEKPNWQSKKEEGWAKLVRQIETLHVNGFDKTSNRHNFEVAAIKHMERITGQKVEKIDIKEAKIIYEALQYTLPKQSS